MNGRHIRRTTVMRTPLFPSSSQRDRAQAKLQMIQLTDIARKQILLAMDDEADATLALRVEITGRGGSGFQYRMDLVETDERRDDDIVVDAQGFEVYVDPDSAPKLEGATIDFVQKLSEAGFKFDNPNSPWSDPLAQQVAEVIETKINPQIASHGGFVTLIDVQDQVALISMGGGCQGCGMADVTLKQGIETMIMEGVPDIVAVRDTTDHAAGENPYFT